MNPAIRISELAANFLAPNQRFDGDRFINELLPQVSEGQEFHCTFAGIRSLRFQLGSQNPWEVDIERAKSKLRILCARLSVLCNETGGQDVSLYGGEGWISEEAIENSRLEWAKHRETMLHASGVPVSGEHLRPNAVLSQPCPGVKWHVCFKNTMHEQEFTIQAQ
jgi:hypothetical protein